MGATISQCTCFDNWLLLDKSNLVEKSNMLESNYNTLDKKHTELQAEFTLFKNDISKRLETLEQKSNKMYFIQEESDPDMIVVHK